MTEFDHAAPVTVSLRAQRGSAELVAEERQTLQVTITADDGSDATDDFRVALEGDTLIVHAPESSSWQRWRMPKAHIAVRVPLDSALAVKSAAADVRATGRWSTAQASLASADAHVEQVNGDAHLKAASGDLTIERVGGALRANSSSGGIRVGDVTGDVTAGTASGNIAIRRAGASLQASTASGDVEVGVLSRGKAKLRTASGDVSVGVAAGTGVWLDLNTASGTTSSDLAMSGEPAEGARLELRIRSASGDIDVHRAMGDLPAAA
jgi:hypothetical protein